MVEPFFIISEGFIYYRFDYLGNFGINGVTLSSENTSAGDCLILFSLALLMLYTLVLIYILKVSD